MSRGSISLEDANKKKPRKRTVKPGGSGSSGAEAARPLANLQQRVGNRAVQRLLAQRSATGPAEVDDETAERINRQRGGGLPLDSGVQKQMGESTGADFSNVKVHADPEADALSQQLGAKAFTTGQDVFFREGEYQPQTSGGQKLLAHELTHVVQQGQGASGGSSGHMTVNPPGDAFEQQADAVAQTVTSGQNAAVQGAAGVQRAAVPEDEEQVQRQEEDEDEDEDEQVQMAPAEEEEDQIQRQEDDEEEQNMKAGR